MKLLNNDFKQTASCSAEKIAAVKSDVLFSSLFTVFVVFSLCVLIFRRRATARSANVKCALVHVVP